MSKYKITCEARRAYSDSIKYNDLAEEGLDCQLRDAGTIPNGKLVEVRVKNVSDCDFLGVIHVRVLLGQKHPQFFMPGYMYGNNTADMPSHGRKEFPRIVEGAAQRPESPYWMTRSDRLAEPVSLIYDEGTVVGIAAAPYWVGDGNADKEAVDFCSKGDKPFYQYSGFTCRIGDN